MRRTDAVKNVSNNLKILQEQFGNPIDKEKFNEGFLKDLSIYVKDKSILEYAIQFETHNWEYGFFLNRIKTGEYKLSFNELFDFFEKAQLLNPVLFEDLYKRYGNYTQKAVRDYADHFQLEREKNFSEEDLLSIKIAFQEIGFSLETCLQPMLRYFLCIIMLAQEKPFIGFEKIDKMTFGQIVNELLKYDSLMKIYCPEPWSVSVSQWRNIAQHTNFNFDKNISKIVCKYGTGSNVKRINISLEELGWLCWKIDDLFCFHKVAHAIFDLGVMDIIRENVKLQPLPINTVVASIIEILTTNSFEIKNFIYNSKKWTLDTVDNLNRPEDDLKAIFSKVLIFKTMIENCAIEFTIKQKGKQIRGRM